MMYRISGLKLPIEHDIDDVFRLAARRCGVKHENFTPHSTISKKSLDCRDKRRIHWVYSVDTTVKPKSVERDVTSVVPLRYVYPLSSRQALQPLVVGSGPAGLFAALVLAEAGLCPIVIERGKTVDERIRDINAFWSEGTLNTDSNVQFGEGGAGTFSDGKLTTGINDPRTRMVLESFVHAGAPDEILYLSKPHIGTDQLRSVIKNLRNRIETLGGEFHFNTKLVDFTAIDNHISSAKVESSHGMYDLPCSHLVLAIGHSARDTFEMLVDNDVAITQKPFSVGVRIEHPQDMIDMAQYGRERKTLPPADYKLSAQLENGRGVYTFCMCPGGVVVAASSESCGIVTNGMSNHARDGVNASSAVLVGVSPSDFESDEPLAGVEFQRKIERAAFASVGHRYYAPAQTVGDFTGCSSSISVAPSYRPGVEYVDLRSILPDFIHRSIAEALPIFGRKIKGFYDGGAVLTAPETRSSSPVRIVRNEQFLSNIGGLIPCGEGAGYAGGIMSAAVDGVKCAEAIIAQINGE